MIWAYHLWASLHPSWRQWWHLGILKSKKNKLNFFQITNGYDKHHSSHFLYMCPYEKLPSIAMSMSSGTLESLPAVGDSGEETIYSSNHDKNPWIIGCHNCACLILFIRQYKVTKFYLLHSCDADSNMDCVSSTRSTASSPSSSSAWRHTCEEQNIHY